MCTTLDMTRESKGESFLRTAAGLRISMLKIAVQSSSKCKLRFKVHGTLANLPGQEEIWLWQKDSVNDNTKKIITWTQLRYKLKSEVKVYQCLIKPLVTYLATVGSTEDSTDERLESAKMQNDLFGRSRGNSTESIFAYDKNEVFKERNTTHWETWGKLGYVLRMLAPNGHGSSKCIMTQTVIKRTKNGAELNIWLFWRVISLDLNPIKYLWKEMRDAVWRRVIKWTKESVGMCRSHIESDRNHLFTGIASEGCATKYLVKHSFYQCVVLFWVWCFCFLNPFYFC